MASKRIPRPKTQEELSQETIAPLLPQGKTPLQGSKRRENQRRRDVDDVKDFTVGLSDIDKAIVYYFNNIIRPSVVQNSVRISVPFIYGSPERWKAVQKDGFYRDQNGKIQTPLIMFKRDSLEKNRTLGNKMDANNPIHFGIFEKRYSQKNVYDRFAAIFNRNPVREFYGVIIPDYVNITYTCIIFTEYVEQMNKIVESINFASDAYWGDSQQFKFRASIDSYTTAVEMSQGEDRVVKTTFQIKLAGYIIADTVNANIGNSNKFFSKAAVKFKLETDSNIETLNARSKTPEKQSPVRFFDLPPRVAAGGMTQEQIQYVGLNSTALTTTEELLSATFENRVIVTPPQGFPPVEEEDFQVFINGVAIPPQNRTTQQVGPDIVVTFNNLGFELDSTDQILIVGKYN